MILMNHCVYVGLLINILKELGSVETIMADFYWV